MPANRWFAGEILVAVGLFACPLPVRAQPSFFGLGFLAGDVSSIAYGVSDDGMVVAGTSTAPNTTSRAFRWTPATGMVSLGVAGSVSTATGISADGQFIVGFHSAVNRGYRWSSATGVMDLGPSPGIARCVSANGNVVAGATNVDPTRAFRWTEASGWVDLGLPSGWSSSRATAMSRDGELIVGTGARSGLRAFTWSSSSGFAELPGLPGSTETEALGTSGDGHFIVGLSRGPSNGHAVRWTRAGELLDLGVLPGCTLGAATAASLDGNVVVGYCDGIPGTRRPFIWTQEAGMQELLPILGGAVPAGWTWLQPMGITPDGRTLVGLGQHGSSEAWIATVPSPSAVTLLALMGLLSVPRRRVPGSLHLAGNSQESSEFCRSQEDVLFLGDHLES
jgi:probable HAF family extracellular repeat protein